MNRATYWLGWSVVIVLFVGAGLVGLKKPPAGLEIVLIALGVPRLHDIGQTGWWVGAIILLELVWVAVLLSLVAAKITTMPGFMMGSGLFVALLTIPVIYLGCIAGEPIANRFGDPPGSGLSYSNYKKPTLS